MEDISLEQLKKDKILSHKKSCKLYYQTTNKLNQAKKIRAKAYDMDLLFFDDCETIQDMDNVAIHYFTNMGLSPILIHRLIIKRHKDYKPYNKSKNADKNEN